jgi:Family of unknown function (DUF6084)
VVDLVFVGKGVELERHAMVPTLFLKVSISNTTPSIKVQNVLLQCQVRIEATRRHYTPEEIERLVELFGEAGRWGEALQSMLWIHTSAQIPAFDSECCVHLPVPCSFDFNVAATKYFYGLESGDVPLTLLFSGTVFYRDTEDLLQMDQISWIKQAECRLPVRIWRDLMDHYYPNSAWLRIDHEIFDQISRYKRQNGFTSWNETLRALLQLQRKEILS